MAAKIKRAFARKAGEEGARRERAWRAPVLLACAAFLVYCANGRWIGAGDTLSNELVPIVLLTQGDLDLAEFDRYVGGPTPGQSGFTTQSRWGLLPGYPIASGLAVTPLYALPVAIAARSHPTTEEWLDFARTAGKIAAAAITAASVAVFLLLARRLGAGPGVALGLSLAYAFGSSAWSISSQALWQHGPGSLLLLLAGVLSLRHVELPTRWNAASLGLVAGLAVAVRITNAIFVAPLFVWVLLRQRRHAVALLAPAAGLTLAAMGWNLLAYSYPLGLHRTSMFETPLLRGIEGILVSPGRGLLLYFPLGLLGLLGFGCALYRLRRRVLESLWLPLAAFVVLHILLVCRFNNWWGGACFGPRLMTEVQPALLLLAIPLFFIPGRWRAAAVATAGVFFVWSVFVQFVGSFLYSGSWNASPAFVDHSPERLWDWRDNPIRRDLTQQRLSWVFFRPRPLTDFRAGYALPRTAVAAAGTTLEIPVRLRNTGSERWLNYGEPIGGLTVNLAYHITPLQALAERREGARTPLPDVVSPGEEMSVALRVTAPEEPGEYLLEVSLVQELVDWFESRDTPPAYLRLSVTPAASSLPRPRG